MTRQKSAGYHNDFKLSQRSWGFNLEDINANPIRWYHGTVDTNTSCEAARATAQLANRYRRNIDYRTVEGLDHGGIQTKKALEVLHWMRE
ncbi:hypothetical protein BDW02DRAFT_501527 [Decorospora gaudefroyi]|uniref:Peptidase S9 prolyl oligopeptidase catalytic domain-containing protein n=1 Tax=Decorospora gaudefroyi TaxID=184978 RepID=A0A6A5KF34_9PLEO|nr:hypothetical protein BDW02DRAFT_501527 [Decorospora gaudefroyi]